jgi:mannose-6-phosphate isomerase-like protein (cupin superfamily)
MIINILFTADDQKSYFKTDHLETPIQQPLGDYSTPFPSQSVQFRQFDAGLIFPMHTAPRAQYVIYLAGAVQVRTSGGETKQFKAGDILLAMDTEGEGHESITIEAGQAVIISADVDIPSP